MDTINIISEVTANTIEQIESFLNQFDLDEREYSIAHEELAKYLLGKLYALRPERLLDKLNTLLRGYGVEAIEHKAIASVIYSSTEAVQYGDYVAEYINMGDTCNLTIVYDRVFNRLRFTCWGDYVELLEQVKAIADELRAIVVSNVIEWDEWVDDDEGNSYFPIRLQNHDGWFTLHYGDPSFDTDHRGLWADDYLIQNMNDDDYLESAIALFVDLFNNY